MKEIIFWFNECNSKNYWYNYTVDYCVNKFRKAVFIKYRKTENWIQLGDLKILFKVDEGSKSYIGWGDTNQYWVEELFNNNFEEFFKTILKEEMKNGKSMEFSRFNRQKI